MAVENLDDYEEEDDDSDDNSKYGVLHIGETGETHKDNSGSQDLPFIENAIKQVFRKLDNLKRRLGFDSIKEEYGTYLKLKDKYLRDRTRPTVGDIEIESIESGLSALSSRLDLFSSLEADEIKSLKSQENPIKVFGRSFDFSNYKKISTYAIYAGSAYLGYKFIIAPILFPVLKKVFNTKVRTGRKGKDNDNIQDAEFVVL